MNPWYLLRNGDHVRGLTRILEDYPQEPTASHVMRLGVAYLWVKDYAAALEHFQHAIRSNTHPCDSFYGMAGVADWCLNKASEAVEYWRAGLDARFVDGAGGVHLPLLLLVASVLRPGIVKRNEIEKALLSKVNDPRVKNWPGPLAEYVLGFGDENSLRGLTVGINERDAQFRKWSKNFYEMILRVHHGQMTLTDFRRTMKGIVDTSKIEWADEKTFLTLIWSEEFFVARHESSLLD